MRFIPTGVFSPDAVNSLLAGDFLTQAVSGALNPHVSGRYLVTKAGVAAMTLAAPTPGADDGVNIQLISTTAQAHTLTATGLLKTGSASVNVATFAAFGGAGVTLVAFNGKWYVEAATGITFS